MVQAGQSVQAHPCSHHQPCPFCLLMEAPRAPVKEGLAHSCRKGGQRAAWSFSFLWGQPQLFQQHHSFPGTANTHPAMARGGPGGLAIQPDGHSFSHSFLLDQLGLGDSQLALNSTFPFAHLCLLLSQGWVPNDHLTLPFQQLLLENST